MTHLFLLVLQAVIAINLALGVIVYVTHRGRLANRVFAILSFHFALWLCCQYLGSRVTDETWLVFWIRQACATSVPIPLLLHLLCGSVARSGETLAGLLRRARVWAAATLATAVLVQTRFFLLGARLPTSSDMIAEPLYGPGFLLFIGFWVVSVSALLWSFFRTLKQAEGVVRLELQIMSLGALFGLVPGILLVLVVPLLTGTSQSACFAPVGVAIWHSAIAYGIATRHIMGVGEFLRGTVTWVLLAVFLSFLYLLVFRAIDALSLGVGEAQRTAAHIAAAVAVALTLAPANAVLRRRTDLLFADGHGALSRLLHQGGDLARSITTVDALFNDFARLLQESLGLAHVRVFLRDGKRFTLHTSRGPAPTDASVPDDEPLVRALRAERQPLLRDVLRRAGGSPLLAQAERGLVRLGAEAAVALHTASGLVGLLLLGPRNSGRIFGRREEEALALLGDQMGIAFENATLYTRLHDARIYDEVLLDNLVTGVVAADPSGCVTVCNREALRILQLPGTDDALGRPAAEILPGAMWEEMRASLTSGGGARDRDLTLRPKTPDELPVRFATAGFGGQECAASGVLLVVQDTSAIRKLEEQIRRSDRLASIGTLAAGMAHEIKNPLVCLKTFAQLLPSQYDDPDFRSTFTPLLGTEVERINTIVSQLLNFSRPVKPTLVPLALHEVLDASWTLAAQQSKAKHLAFERRYEAERDLLLGDRHLLGQVFLNLFLNGIDATDRGGGLSVATRTVGPPRQPPWSAGPRRAYAWIEVQVRDSGHGIAPEDRLRIFDPFFTTKANGTGLGLSVAHGIVLEHQGLIDVESDVGAGTCFRVLLPLLAPENAPADTAMKGPA